MNPFHARRPSRWLSVLMVLLMLPIGVAPGASAWHLVPEDVEAPEGSPFHVEGRSVESEVVSVRVNETGNMVVDETTADGMEVVAQSHGVLNATYRMLRGAALQAPEDLTPEEVDNLPMTIFRDGTGMDPRTGGFGQWSVLGDEAWGDRDYAALRGDSGFTQATAEDRLYLPGQDALLVSPEIDLATGGLHRGQGADVDAAGGSSSIQTLSTAYSTTYRAMVVGCAGAEAQIAAASMCTTYQALFSEVHPYSLDYSHRFNLALDDSGEEGRDGVAVIVFTRPPESVQEVEDCGLPGASAAFLCTVVLPAGGYPVEDINTMPERAEPSLGLAEDSSVPTPGYSGYSDWTRGSVDLTSWEGQSVWIGFHFTSGPFQPGGNEFRNPARFNPTADFVGFQLDELGVNAPAAPFNLKVKEPTTEPSPVFAGRPLPTLAPGLGFQAQAYVANHGTSSMQVVTTLRVQEDPQDNGDWTTVHDAENNPLEIISSPITMAPGDILEPSVEVPGLPIGNYRVQVCTERVPDDGPDDVGDDTHCDPDQPDPCNQDLLDADACDNVAVHVFKVDPILDLDVSPLRKTARETRVGEIVTVSMDVENSGNVPQAFHARARVIDVTRGAPFERVDMLQAASPDTDKNAQLDQAVALAAGERTTLTWEVKALTVGQYRLLVDLVGHAQDALPFDPDQDLLPRSMQPWRTAAVDGTITIDGNTDPTVPEEWRAKTTHLHPTLRSRAGNNQTHLFIALDDSDFERFEIYFDDRRDGAATAYAVNESGVRPLRYDADALAWLDAGGTEPSIEGVLGASPQPNDMELKIPIGVGSAEHGLAAAPGDAVRFMIRQCDDQRTICRSFPEGAPVSDGGMDSLFPADGALDDETERWHALQLAEVDGLTTETSFPPQRHISSGFGVGMVPPPYFAEDFSACPSFVGWVATSTEFDGVRDQWNCHTYDDAGGQTLLYQGVHPDSQCPKGACGGEHAVVHGTRQLFTRPFDIPVDAQAPTVVLSHQYSTEVIVDDDVGQVVHRSLPQVFLEVFDETAYDFEEVALLRPDGGYPSEGTVGLNATGREFLVPSEEDGTGDARGWWWPQGEQPHHRAPDQPAAFGSTFHGGSPWTTDTVRLDGDHFGTSIAAADLAGRSVRLRFDHTFEDTPAMADRIMTGLFLVGESAMQSVESRRVLSQVERPFTGICYVDADGNGEFDRTGRSESRMRDSIYLTNHPDGCAGAALPTDISLLHFADVDTNGQGPEDNEKILPAGSQADASRTEYDDDCGGSSQGARECKYGHAGSMYSAFPPGTTLDWLDDGDGRFGPGDKLVLDSGGDGEGLGDSPLPDRFYPGHGKTAVSKTVANYCGFAGCGPTARAVPIDEALDAMRLWDGDGDGRWSGNGGQLAQTARDRVFLRAAPFDSATFPHFNATLDWGWRIGGMVALEGGRFHRDLVIDDVSPVTPFDPRETGLGPGTTVPVQVSVHNLGEKTVTRATVQLVGTDVFTHEEICRDEGEVEGTVGGGKTSAILLDCTIGASRDGTRLALRASVEGASDQFRANDMQTAHGSYPVRARPDVGVEVGVDIRKGSSDTPRTFLITLENEGNVDLDGIVVEKRLSKVTDEGFQPIGLPATWHLDETLSAGSRALLTKQTHTLDGTPPIRRGDLVFTPGAQGEYVLDVRVTVPGDVRGDNDRGTTLFSTQTVLYEQDLDTRPFADEGVVRGHREELELDEKVWSVRPAGPDGSQALAAGDPLTLDIPVGADASFHLPTIDLSVVKDATLSFKHRYDLEEGFDAARAEVSADGGATWAPLVPTPKPLNGLPEGYPSRTLIGANAILGADFELDARSYTGRSEDLPSHEGGWVTEEIDLTRQPDFFVDKALEAFNLDGMEGRPEMTADVRTFKNGQEDVMFTRISDTSSAPGPGEWGLNEPRWYENQRYWWIDDATHARPKPMDGHAMWWSGTSGTAQEPSHQAGDETMPRADTTLKLELDPGQWGFTRGAGDEVVLSWWDWRAGGNDGTDRPGTGGEFHVRVDGTEVPVRTAEQRHDGWSRRQVTLPPGLLDGPLAVEFHYLSGSQAREPLATPPAPPGKTDMALAYYQDNRGWFVDGVEVIAYTPEPGTGEPDPSTLRSLPHGEDEAWSTTTAYPAESPVWSVVGQGQADPTGPVWHLDAATIADRQTMVWRFNSTDPEGYPPNARSHVVTPLVDLEGYAGESVNLEFDHRYGFSGGPQRAVDGGTVTYQVYDSTTHTFGPWQQLGAQAGSEPLLEVADILQDGAVRSPARNWPTTVSGADDALDDMGYTAIAPMPPSTLTGAGRTATTGFGQDFPVSQAQIRFEYNPETYRSSWQPFPLAYAFSGDSGGFEHVAWDVSHLIGKQVRFGFQAWTNPSDGPCTRSGAHSFQPSAFFGIDVDCPLALHGWSLGNIQITGQAFEGGPADIRFRLATDGSYAKGEWRVDDIRVTGNVFDRNVVIKTSDTNILENAGSPLAAEAEVVNLGKDPRFNLLVEATARITDTNKPLTDAEKDLSDALVIVGLDPVPEEAPAGFGPAYGPFDLLDGSSTRLGPDGTPRHTLPFGFGIDLPEIQDWQEFDPNYQNPDGTVGGYPPVAVEVKARLLEGTVESRIVDGELVSSIEYALAGNEVGGIPSKIWKIRVVDGFLDLQPEAPFDTRSSTLVADPSAVQPAEDMTFTSAVANAGTVEPSVEVLWTVEKIERKGGQQQRGVRPETAHVVAEQTTAIGRMERGETAKTSIPFTPTQQGLHRVRTDIRALQDDGTQTILPGSALEFHVGDLPPYYRRDFSDVDAQELDWEDQSPPVDNPTGGSPPEVGFRLHDGRLIWGVEPEEYGPDMTYCSFGGCRRSNPNDGGAPNDGHRGSRVYGLHGIADGPRIDLGTVVGDNVVLTLEHSHAFQDPGDGARLEVLPLQSPVGESAQPAFRCSDDRPMWFALSPEEPGYQGSAMAIAASVNPKLTAPRVHFPARITPLFDDPMPVPGSYLTSADPPPRIETASHAILGGTPTESEVLRFFLDQEPRPICEHEAYAGRTGSPQRSPMKVPSDLEPPQTLVNYTLIPRLRTGTLPDMDPNEMDCQNPNRRPQCIMFDRTGAMGWQIDAITLTSIEVEVDPPQRTLPVLDGYAKRFNFLVTNAGSAPETFRVVVDEDTSDKSAAWLEFPQTQILLAPSETRAFSFNATVPSEPPPSRGTYVTRLRIESISDPLISDSIDLHMVLDENPLPDLSMHLGTGEAEQGKIPQLQQGVPTELFATTFNIGRKPTEPFQVQLNIFRNDTQGGADLVHSESKTVSDVLCAIQDAACDEEESRKTTGFTWVVPKTLGRYRIEAHADAADRLVEVSKVNNHDALLVDVIPLQLPDVAVANLTMRGVDDTGYAKEGSLVTMQADITNLGEVGAEETTVRIVAGTVELAKHTLQDLQPGETRHVNASRLVSRGETTIRAMVIPPSSDADDDNNELRSVLRVRGVDLRLEHTHGTMEIEPGKAKHLALTLRNDGNAVERVLLSLAPTHEGWGLAASPNPVTIAPASNVTTMLTVSSPDDATGGVHNLTIIGVPRSEPGIRVTTHVLVDVPARTDAPDIEILSERAGPEGLPVRLVSHSNVAEALSLDLEALGVTVGNRSVVAAPGQTVLLDVPVAVPPSTPPGPTPVVLRAYDSVGSVVASANGSFHVGMQLRGNVSWADTGTWTPLGLSSRALEYGIHINNTGNVPFRPVLHIVNLTHGFSTLEQDPIPQLGPGEHRLVVLAVEGPVERTEEVRGQMEAWIHAAAVNGTDESATASIRAATLDIPSLTMPDLEVTRVRITPPGTLRAGDPVDIQVTIRNRGIVPSPATTLFSYVDGDLVNAYATPQLQPGQENTLNITWSFTREGEHLIHMLANGDQATKELYTDNNGRNHIVAVEETALGKIGIPAPALPLVLFLLGIMVCRRQRGDPT